MPVINSSFPLEGDVVSTAKEYMDFFSSQASILTTSKQICSCFTLTSGDAHALEGLRSYLQQRPQFFSKELIINLEPSAFLGDSLQETLKLLADKGLTAVTFISKESNEKAAIQVLDTVKAHKISLDINLWAGVDAAQHELDQCISVFKREKRIAALGQTIPTELPSLDKDKPKRTRKKNTTPTIDMDTEVQVEIAVEVAVEVAVEKAIEEQHEDKGTPEFIDRAEFVRRAKAQTFKIDPSCYARLKGFENRTWDRWMGNIHQAVVEPEKKRKKVGIVVGRSANRSRAVQEGFNYNYSISYFGPEEPIDWNTLSIYFETRVSQQDFNITAPFRSAEAKQAFIEQFIPEGIKGVCCDYLSIELSDAQWEAARPKESPHFYKDLPLYYIDETEKWKGEYIRDADDLDETEDALEAFKRSCPIPFKNPQISLRLYPNTNISLMTAEACEQLLAYQTQLQYGLDFAHLPAGFQLNEMLVGGKIVSVLHYKEYKTHKKSKDPYAIELQALEPIHALSHDLFLQWRSSGADPLLQQHYEALEKHYDRKQIAEFKRYLPIMRLLPSNLLTKYGKETKDFIQAAIQYRTHLTSVKGVLKSHLLTQFLEYDSNTEMRDELKNWDKRLNFTAADLNGLLGVYNSYGSKGLTALFSIWEKASIIREDETADDSLLLHLKKHYFPHCTSFVPLLDTSFENAINILKHLPQNERTFWNKLFEQHMSFVEYDALYPLVKAFQDFSTQVKEKKLKFYKESHFSQLKNLQVALSRMMSILDNTPLSDLPLVWQGITSLDLGSSGAIRLLNDKAATKNQGQLIVPKMKLSPSDYAEKHDYSLKQMLLPGHGYQALRVRRTEPSESIIIMGNEYYDLGDQISSNLPGIIALSKDSEELEINYYRFISAQEHRLSLDFYQKAAAFIDKATESYMDVFKFKMRAGFYALIAGATSGFKAKAHIQNEADVLKSVINLWESINKIHFPIGISVAIELHRLSIITSLLKRLVPMAPFPYLTDLMAMVQKGLSLGWSDITSEGFFKRREEVCKILDSITYVSHTHDYAFYEGIKFINSEQITYEDYSKYAKLAEKIIKESRKYYDFNENYSGPLIRLMSTFQLNEDIVFNIYLLGSSAEFITLLSNSLSLLTKMQINTSLATQKPLTQKDLLSFINYLAKESDLKNDSFVIRCVQNYFSAYFSPDFFKDLANPGLSLTITSQINRNFKTTGKQNLVTNLILSFKELEDKLAYKEAVPLLIRISKQLKSSEREQFLYLLGSLNTHLDNKLSELITLLNAIGERGTIDDLIFLMEYAKQEKVPNLIPKITLYYKQVLPILYGKKREHLSLADLQPLAAQLVLNTPKTPEEFETSLIEVLNALERVIDYCPNEKQAILTLISGFIRETKIHAHFDLLTFVTLLGEAGQFDISSGIIRSLSDHYHSKPLEIYSLLDTINHSEHYQRSILLMITSLLNNNRPCALEVIKEFLELCSLEKFQLFQLSETFFKSPPYPSFEQIIGWHKEYQGCDDYKEKMEQSYQQYKLKPCDRELENGFKLSEALELASRFQGMTFEEGELKTLDKEIQAVKEDTNEVLQEALKNLSTLTKAEQEKQYPRLVAIEAELLYRSKGSAGGKGLSYELNSVQYLAVLAFLKSNGHITSEMATGEGKSRTMMISIACQFALGKTVDFVTSDMQLAQRDYLEYQAFFKILNAKTRLISASSDPGVYQPEGIHFSDASNLSLFRNKARSQGMSAKVIDPDPTKRALLLDEADRTYFDISETRFNYSDLPKDSPIKNMEWIYPFLIRFFKQSDPKVNKRNASLYEKDIDGCTAAFIEFMKAQAEYNEDMLALIEEVSSAQLESWQEAAVTALDLKLGTHYALEPNVLIETTRGPKLATEARLIYGNRLSKNSKFSFGVHQCLHAYLNIELQNPNSATSLKCIELARLQNQETDPSQVAVQPFFIHPEKQIVYSSSSKSFLNEYQSGDIWAITGTAGAILEQEEASALYESDTHPMKFINVPRKNSLQRTDHSLRLTGDLQQRVAAILEYIVEARQSGRPVLVICEDDTQANIIRTALEVLLKNKPESEPIPKEQWQFIDSTSSSQQEQAAIANAGKTGTVTIATSRLGRGTDIKLSEKSKKAGGLRVLGSYLPRERDQWQIFGRSGRYGDQGDTRLIVDKQQLLKQLGQKNLDTDFFLSNEFYVQSKQALMEKDKQIERLVRNSLSDFRMKITDNFFKYYDDLLLKEDLPSNKRAIDSWAQCTKKMDQIWNQVWPKLDSLMKDPEVNIAQIKAHLAQFKQQAQKEWDELHTQLGNSSKGLPKQLEDLKLDSRTEHLLGMILPKRRYSQKDRTQVYQAYDKALDGRAVIYDNLFTELKATLRGERNLFANTRAYLGGHGILFADSRAVLSGKRPLFANLRAWMSKNNAAKKEQQLHCNTILEALEKGNSQELSYFVRYQNATQFLEPKKDDLLLSFKIQLIETILNYAHSQLEHKGNVSKKDMRLISELLNTIKTTLGDQPILIALVVEKLKPLRTGFFGHSLKKDISAAIKKQEEQTEENPGKSTKTKP